MTRKATVSPAIRRESRRRIKRLIKNLLAVWGFFGQLALRLPLVEDSTRRTIASDGRKLYYNPQWVSESDDDPIRAIIAGLVLRCALKHHTRRGDRDYAKWQWASQQVALPFLRDAGLTDEAGGLDSSIEKAYLQAPDPSDDDDSDNQSPDGQPTVSIAIGGVGAPQSDPDGQSDDQDGDGDSDGADGQQDKQSGQQPPSTDDAGQGEIMDSPANKQKGAGDQDGDGSGDGDGAGAGGSGGGSGGDGDGSGGDGDDGEGIDGADPPPPPPPDPVKAEEQEWDKALEQAIQIDRAQSEKAHGTVPGNLLSMVRDMHKHQIDWRTLLRRFMLDWARNDYSWSQPNRRHVHRGVYLPAARQESMDEIVFAVDTSGSMDYDELSRVWTEIRSAAEEIMPEKVTVIQGDERVQDVQVYGAGDLPREITVKGRGGTDFRPVFEYMDKHRFAQRPAVLIYMTDLMGYYPETDPGFPVLWLDTCAPHYQEYRSSMYNPPFGEIVPLPPVEDERAAG